MLKKITKEQSENIVWSRNKILDRFLETHEISDEKKYNNNMLSDLDYFNIKHRVQELDEAIISFTYNDTIENEWNFISKKNIDQSEYMILLVKIENEVAFKKDLLENSPVKSKKIILNNLTYLTKIINKSNGIFVEKQDNRKINIFKIINKENVKTIEEIKLPH